MAQQLLIDRAGDFIAVTWQAAPTRWRLILEDFKSQFGALATFDGNTRRWRLPADQRQALLAWGLQWFLPHEIEFGRQRPVSRQLVDLDMAYRALHLLPSAPNELVDSAHRILAKAAHPDCGGDHTTMVALNNAHDAIRAVRS